MLQIEEIRTPEGLAGLDVEWAALWEASGRDSIFLTLPWIRIAATWPLRGCKPLILLAREEGRLVAVAPLALHKTKVRRFPVTEITFLKTPITPWCDFLVDQSGRLGPLFDHLDGLSWDRLTLDRLRQDSPNRAEIEAEFQKRGVFTNTVDAEVSVLPIAGPWDDFHASKSKNFRKARRKIANRVDRLGEWTVTRATSPDDGAAAFRDMMDVSARGWKRLDGRDLMQADYERGLLEALTTTAAEHGWLTIWLLKLDGRPLAAEYHLEDGRTVYGLRTQFDHEFADASPGSHLDTLIVKHLFDHGYEGYDMGPGAMSYKLAWTEDGYTNRRVQRYAGTLYGRFLRRFVDSWIPAVKRLLKRSKAAN